ncbi:hypothetical protein DFH27DRAFT_21306 [Peziza echinospora]|nr:hypothetical protein DFH27DRAFT_21306 [Peziza echinospora]
MMPSFATLAALALPLLAVVSAQAPLVCFQDCANTSFQGFGCPGLDFNCYCGLENGAFIKRLATCVQAKCTPETAKLFESFLDASKCPVVPSNTASASVSAPASASNSASASASATAAPVTTATLTTTVTSTANGTTPITTTVINGSTTYTTTIIPSTTLRNATGTVTIPTSTSLTTITQGSTTVTSAVTTFFGTSTVSTDAPSGTETDSPGAGAVLASGQYFAAVAAGLAAVFAAL